MRRLEDKVDKGIRVKMEIRPIEVEEAIGDGKLYIEPAGLRR